MGDCKSRRASAEVAEGLVVFTAQVIARVEVSVLVDDQAQDFLAGRVLREPFLAKLLDVEGEPICKHWDATGDPYGNLPQAFTDALADLDRR